MRTPTCGMGYAGPAGTKTQNRKQNQNAERNLGKKNKAEMVDMDKDNKTLYGPVKIINPK